METFVKILFGLAIAFILVAYPILIAITIWMFPVYVIIAFILWIVFSVVWICFRDSNKIRDYIWGIGIADVVFTIIYISGSSNVDFLEDAKGIAVIGPTLCTPAICYLGIKILDLIKAKKLEEENRMRNEVKNDIQKYLENANHLKRQVNEQIKDDKRVGSLVKLISSCTENKRIQETYYAAEQKIFTYQRNKLNGIGGLENVPQSKREFDNYMKQQNKSISSCKEIQCEIDTYEYKKLKDFYKTYKKNKQKQ